MKPRSHLPLDNRLALAVAVLSLAFASLAAQAPTNAPSKTQAAATNASPIQVEVPKSVFNIPSTPQEGKDPFFPRSMRIFTSSIVSTKTNPPPVVIAVDLRLSGISGTADHRLAIINNRTFAANEEGLVPTSSGAPARIRCLEIKADSVLVQIGGEQRLLRLRPGFN